jgi:hypothetical protein
LSATSIVLGDIWRVLWNETMYRNCSLLYSLVIRDGNFNILVCSSCDIIS